MALVAFGGCQTRDLANPVAGQSGSAEADTLRLLHTDQREYRAGDRVELTLKNTTGKVVGTNLCFVYLTLERAVQGEWAPVSGPLAPPMTACFSQLDLVSPGKSLKGEATLPPELPGGRYRLRVSGEYDHRTVTLLSQDFTVKRRSGP